MHINIILRCGRATIVVVENLTIITYYKCVSLVLGIQHAMRMRHTAQLHHIFPQHLINGKIFGKTLQNKKNVYFDILYKSV
jgi:hypothetical protein